MDFAIMGDVCLTREAIEALQPKPAWSLEGGLRDANVQVASDAGATVRWEPMQGKGPVEFPRDRAWSLDSLPPSQRVNL